MDHAGGLRSHVVPGLLLHVHQLRWAQNIFIFASISKPDFQISNTRLISTILGQKVLLDKNASEVH